MSKFLVLWSLDSSKLGTDAVKSVLSMPKYADNLKKSGKLEKRYHLVGQHGGAWIYDVDTNEELDRLLAQAPIYNFANFTLYPLAEMPEAGTTESDS